MIDLGILLNDTIEMIKTAGVLFKDGSAAVVPLLGPAKSLWNWVKRKFANDELALEQLRQVEQDPANSQLLNELRYALKQHLVKDLDSQKQLAELTGVLADAVQNARGETRNYMENNSSTFGSIFQNAKNVTINQNINFNSGNDTKKKS